MQKNWYIIYTKSRWEKKVASSLKKRKIETYLPLHFKYVESFRKIIRVEEPLFERYVFANFEEDNLSKLKNIDGVINLVFWKGQPARINNAEIDVISAFTKSYENIIVEKIKIDNNALVNKKSGFIYSINGNILRIKNTAAKVNLPSIGFRLIARMGLTDEIPEIESVFVKKDLFIQS